MVIKCTELLTIVTTRLGETVFISLFSLAGRESAKEKWFVLLPNKNFEEKHKVICPKYYKNSNRFRTLEVFLILEQL